MPLFNPCAGCSTHLGATATRLGAYEIVAPFGAGGMGEVYRRRTNRRGAQHREDVGLRVVTGRNAHRALQALARLDARRAQHHLLTYLPDESGRMEAYIQSYPIPGDKCQVTTGGGFWVAWSPDGKALGCGLTSDPFHGLEAEVSPEGMKAAAAGASSWSATVR